MPESWKPIKGYEGLYEVSNLGRIKSLERIAKGTNRKIREMIRKPNIMKGYHCIALVKDGHKKVFRIHRLVIEAFGEPQPSPVHQVDHIDGNKANNSIENLEWVTPAENTKRSFDTGLRKRHPTEETLAKLAEGTKKRWEDKDYRESQRKMMADTWKRRKENGWQSWKTAK